MKFHPYSEVFPLLEGAAFDELVADIKAFGLREKIWFYEGKILDGRNRFLACQKAKVEPEFREFRGKPAGALALVISANIHRRQLTNPQRAFAAAELAKLGAGRPDLISPIGEIGLTQAEAASALKVSKRSVERARKVKDQGSKSLQKAAQSGEVALSRAAAVVDLPKRDQLAAAKAPKEDAPVDLSEFGADVEAEEREYTERIDRVLKADDRLAQMGKELERAAKEIVALKQARDRYMNECAAMRKQLAAKDREIAKMKKAA